MAGGKKDLCPRSDSAGPRVCAVHLCACVSVCGLMWCLVCVGVGCVVGFPLGSPSCLLRSASQEILFYKVIDYILHGKEDIKVIP